ncbi:tetraspanin-6-like [Protobothrops mucrosquamatus]|uniref:tetraspanin-6-like n=1 Tax=Protobothrops mucrosquamatus TaxID=103944 RepID=UPI0010FAF92D|nr:tetraspanin-6-like [Protobothrops mucrosquamatus]
MKGEGRIIWEKCLKIALWLTVLLYWVAGVVLITTGVCVQVKLHYAFVVLNEAASGVAVTVTVIGALIIMLSGFGAIALFRSSKAMIKFFTGLLVLLLITEILVVATAYACRVKLHQTVSKDFMKILNKYNKKLQITKGVDILQAGFQCCGAENYTDWQNTTFGLLSSSVPKSCCKIPVESCVTDLNEDTVGINQEGCLLKLKSWTERNISAFGGLAVLIVFGQVTGILLCYILLKIINEDYDNVEQA